VEYKGIILSLCDESGAWSRPYVALGYKVIRVDPKHGVWREHYQDRGMTDKQIGNGTMNEMEDGGFGLSASVQLLANILSANPTFFGLPVRGILMAPPCTDFSGSGARHWPAKDEDGRTAVSVSIIRACLQVKDILKPDWWVLENPVGRLARLVPEVGKYRMTFHPCMYAGWLEDPDTEAYTKLTCLFGNFNANLERRDVEPIMFTLKNGKRGSWMFAKLGGKSERTKELRSKTPVGFSLAFAAANP